MSVITSIHGSRSSFLAALVAATLIATIAPPAFAGSAEAQTVINELQDGDHPENVNYSFLEVDYDDSSSVLHFAVNDGQHFETPQNLYYRVPVADINDVSVISNADKTRQDGQIKDIGADMGPNETGFTRIPQGCSVKLWAKDPSFGWLQLEEGAVQDGKLVETPSDDQLEGLKTVTIGFYDCVHARKLQHSFHELHKQVKKGS